MLRTLATSVALACATCLVVAGVALPETAHAAPKKPPPSKGGGKKKPPPPDGKGPFAKNKYPLGERIRPLVLPNQMGEVGLDLDYVSAGGAGIVSTTASFAYGLGDVVEVGIATGLLLSPDVAYSRSLVLQGHYLAYDGKDFDFAPGLLLPITFVENAPFGLVLDLSSRYVASNVVFFRFGQGAIPIGVSPAFTMSIVANGGVGFQVSKPVVLFADTSILTANVAPEVAFTGFWEVFVLSLGGQYSPTRYWDVGAKVDLSTVWELEDSLSAGVTLYGRFRF